MSQEEEPFSRNVCVRGLYTHTTVKQKKKKKIEGAVDLRTWWWPAQGKAKITHK